MSYFTGLAELGPEEPHSIRGKRYVLYCRQWGVLLRMADNLVVFSGARNPGYNRTMPGQAITFSKGWAVKVANQLKSAFMSPVEVRFMTKEVVPDCGNFASMLACVKAGLPGWDTLPAGVEPIARA